MESELAIRWPWIHPNPSPYSWSDFPVDGQVNPTRAEQVMRPQLIGALKNFYNDTGIILHFTSAYRSPDYNIGEGGAEHSAHTQGKAVDSDYGTVGNQRLSSWQIFDYIAGRAYQEAISHGLFDFNQLYHFNTAVYYPIKGHVHLDVRFHLKCGLRATRLGMVENNKWCTFCADEIKSPRSHGAILYAQYKGEHPPAGNGELPVVITAIQHISMWMWVLAGISAGSIILTTRTRRKV